MSARDLVLGFSAENISFFSSSPFSSVAHRRPHHVPLPLVDIYLRSLAGPVAMEYQSLFDTKYRRWNRRVRSQNPSAQALIRTLSRGHLGDDQTGRNETATKKKKKGRQL